MRLQYSCFDLFTSFIPCVSLSAWLLAGPQKTHTGGTSHGLGWWFYTKYLLRHFRFESNTPKGLSFLDQDRKEGGSGA